MAMPGAPMMEFIQRLQGLRAHHDSADQLVQDLLLYSQQVETSIRGENETIVRQLHNTELDLEDSKKSRRELQMANQALQQENQRLMEMVASTRTNDQHLQNGSHGSSSRTNETDLKDMLEKHNPYVIVLMDGNGLLFKNHYVRRGIDGGRKAALALKAAILKQCYGVATEIEVIVKICVNLAGLAQAMRSNGGLLESERDLKDFTLGFTQAVSSFYFVDIGSSRPDVKIKEATTWHLKNYNCKHVILGISHDASYATFIEGLMQGGSVQRVTIIEGAPTVRDLVATGVNIVNMNDQIFRAEKLVARSSPLPIAPLPPPVTSPRVMPAAIAAAAVRPASTPAVAPPSYARAIKNASPPPQLTLPIPPKAKPTAARQASVSSKPPQPPWNPGPRGLDSPLHVSQTALESVKRRKDSDKLCNNHYLRGPCSKGDECIFEHKYKPSAEEIVAIAYLTRFNPCTAGQDCDVENCIYGHHCPTVVNGKCTHPLCKFTADQHPPGTIMATRKTSLY